MRRDIFTDEHDLFRAQFRRFAEAEIEPKVEKWNREGKSDRESWRRAGAEGFLGLSKLSQLDERPPLLELREGILRIPLDRELRVFERLPEITQASVLMPWSLKWTSAWVLARIFAPVPSSP